MVWTHPVQKSHHFCSLPKLPSFYNAKITSGKSNKKVDKGLLWDYRTQFSWVFSGLRGDISLLTARHDERHEEKQQTNKQKT